MGKVVLSGRRFVARIEAEAKDREENWGNIESGDNFVRVKWWQGGGKIIDRKTRRAHLFNFASGSTPETLKPLDETIIQFKSHLADDSACTMKDRRRIIDIVLADMLEQAKTKEKGKTTCPPTVVPKSIELQRLIDLKLVSVDPASRLKLRCHSDVMEGMSTEIESYLSLPLNALLHNGTEIRDMAITTIFDSKEARTRIEGNKSNHYGFGSAPPSIELKELLGEGGTTEIGRIFDGSPESAMGMHQSVVRRIADIVNKGRAEYLKMLRKQYWDEILERDDKIRRDREKR